MFASLSSNPPRHRRTGVTEQRDQELRTLGRLKRTGKSLMWPDIVRDAEFFRKVIMIGFGRVVCSPSVSCLSESLR